MSYLIPDDIAIMVQKTQKKESVSLAVYASASLLYTIDQAQAYYEKPWYGNHGPVTNLL